MVTLLQRILCADANGIVEEFTRKEDIAALSEVFRELRKIKHARIKLEEPYVHTFTGKNPAKTCAILALYAENADYFARSRSSRQDVYNELLEYMWHHFNASSIWANTWNAIACRTKKGTMLNKASEIQDYIAQTIAHRSVRDSRGSKLRQWEERHQWLVSKQFPFHASWHRGNLVQAPPRNIHYILGNLPYFPSTTRTTLFELLVKYYPVVAINRARDQNMAQSVIAGFASPS
jgi:hypothetical protein